MTRGPYLMPIRGPKFIDSILEPCHENGPAPRAARLQNLEKVINLTMYIYICYTMKIQTHKSKRMSCVDSASDNIMFVVENTSH